MSDLDLGGLQRKLEATEREVQDFNTQIGKLNLQIRDLEEGKATVVKRAEEIKADIEHCIAENGG